MNFNEQYPSSFDNYPRPSKMKRPNISSIATGAATRFIGYIGDQLANILIDKYGKTRGEKTFQGLLDTGNNAIYTVCTNIIKEKIKMFQDLGIPDSEYMNKDYFDTSYYALWSKWMDEFVKKPYSHLIKKENNSDKEDILVSFVNHVGEINNTVSGDTNELTANGRKILTCYWNEWGSIVTFANKNNIKLKILDKFVDGNGDECVEFCEGSKELNEKINKLKESIEKLSGKKVKLIESISAYDMQDAYSFDKMGYVIGESFLEAFKEVGFTSDKELETIFRSKLPRYFMDENQHEIANFVKTKAFKFAKEHKEYVKKEILKENRLIESELKPLFAFYFGEWSDDNIQDVSSYLAEKYIEGVDYNEEMERGDDVMHTLKIYNKSLLSDKELDNLLKECNIDDFQDFRN